MLIIDEKLVKRMWKLAYKHHPIQSCGVIAGIEGSNTPARLIPMCNMAKSISFFQFNQKQQLKVWKDMKERGEEPVVIFHSHTNSVAYPGCEDIELADEPHAHYVIIPTNPLFEKDLRSFRIVNGTVTEEGIQTVTNNTKPTAMKLSMEMA
jgi:proteasome lid subunit RPN8/RPN11